MQAVHMFCFKNRWLFCSILVLAAGAGGILWQPVHPPLLRDWSDVLESLSAWGLLLMGLGLRFWATLYIGGNKSKALVALGPYSVCRNPLYIGNLVIFLSIGIFLRSWIFLASVAVVAVFYHLFVIRYEEANLRRRLGPAYDEYRQRVPAWWPNFSLYRDSVHIRVKTKNLLVEARRTAAWIVVPFAIEFVRHEIW